LKIQKTREEKKFENGRGRLLFVSRLLKPRAFKRGKGGGYRAQMLGNLERVARQKQEKGLWVRGVVQHRKKDTETLSKGWSHN